MPPSEPRALHRLVGRATQVRTGVAKGFPRRGHGRERVRLVLHLGDDDLHRVRYRRNTASSPERRKDALNFLPDCQ